MARIRKVRVERGGAGRPSKVERGIVDSLVFNANMMRQWQIDTNRIATGRSASSYKVIVERPKNPVTQALGIVSGKIVAAKHTKFALEGRGPGKAPAIHAIEEWLVAKKIKSKEHTRAQLARMISRSIAANGTLPPHFTERIQTKITRASTTKMINIIKPHLQQALGRRYVRTLLKAADMADSLSASKNNVSFGGSGFKVNFNSKTVTLTNEEMDQILTSGQVGRTLSVTSSRRKRK